MVSWPANMIVLYGMSRSQYEQAIVTTDAGLPDLGDDFLIVHSQIWSQGQVRLD